ncbi:MAG: hypothetical protein NT082_03485 [Chloroflexi bacterium]|nr:hypothetical protein [Chloroflexota bacterium]
MLKHFNLFSMVLAVSITIALFAVCAPGAETPPANVTQELSFTPLTYTNDQYSFLIQYPDNYKEDKSKENDTTIFNAVGPLAGNRIPVLTVNIFDADKAADQGIDLLKSRSGSDIKITPLGEITLADGKTRGKISTVAWYNNDAKFDMRGLSLGVIKGNYQITVTITSIFVMYNEDKYMEILKTFELK